MRDTSGFIISDVWGKGMSSGSIQKKNMKNIRIISKISCTKGGGGLLSMLSKSENFPLKRGVIIKPGVFIKNEKVQ